MKKSRFCFFLAFFLTVAASAQTGSAKYTVYYFLSDGCPMCRGYASGAFNQLYDTYGKKGVDFVGVFPNFYATDSTIAEFQHDMNLPFRLQKDVDFHLTDQFKITVTPQVVVADATGAVFYNGMIDNAYYQPGKRRGATSVFYLKNALNALLEGKSVGISNTSPIGCVVVRN